MMRPSTKAIAGALNRSRRSPRSSWCPWMSKSGYSSRAARGSSLVLPVVSTARAQRRSSSCMPPVEASRRRATSSRESTSRPPPGKIRASTVGSLGVVAIALVVSSMEPVYGGGGRGGKRNGRVSPAVPVQYLSRGSELVLEADLRRPLRDAVGEAVGVARDRRIVREAVVVHVLAVVDALQGRNAGRGEEAVI